MKQNTGETVVLTREELFDRVWTTAMRNLAPDLGVSDVGLKKICQRFNIPTPPVGYWAKKDHGKAPTRPQLPKSDDPGIDGIKFYPNASVLPIAERVDRREIEIDVAENLRGAHPLVAQAKAELHTAEVGDHKILVMPEGATLRVEVSKASLRRSLLIMDAVLRAVELAGHTVSAGPRAAVDGVTVGFDISEQIETSAEPVEDHDLSGPYTFGHSRFEESRVPSGRLVLSIALGGYWHDRFQRTWRDTKRRRLEERLDGFVAGLIEAASRVKQREEQQRLEAEQRRQEELRRQQEAQRRKERRDLQKAEQARVDQLLREADSWHAARRLREYVGTVQASITAGHDPESKPELAKWVEWATLQADRLDPLKPSPPSILDEDLGPDEPPSRFGRGW